MTALGDAEAIIGTAIDSVAPIELDPEKRYAVSYGGSGDSAGVQIIEPVIDAHRAAPRRVSGSAVVFDPDGLNVLWEKYSTDASELFADPTAFNLTAVFNADTDGETPGFRDHRAVLQCVVTTAWKKWLALDGKLGEQTVFAEHLEDRAIDLINPVAAEMLELAQHFEASTKVDFQSAANLGSGQRGLVYKETVAAKAGETGQIVIPQVFEIGVQVFEGGPAYKINARLRYRIREGKLFIGYALERPEDTKRLAFDDVTRAASEACGRLPLVGTPYAGR